MRTWTEKLNIEKKLPAETSFLREYRQKEGL